MLLFQMMPGDFQTWMVKHIPTYLLTFQLDRLQSRFQLMLDIKHLAIKVMEQIMIYTDWKVNADYAFNDNFSAGAFYTDTDQKKDNWTVAGKFLGDSVFGGYLSAGF